MFEHLYRHHYRELLHFLTGLVRDRDAAADLVQESYTRVLAVQHAGGVIVNPRALLYRTARNLVTDRHRRAVHRDHADIEGLLESDEPRAPIAIEPDAALASAQGVRALVEAIESLPPRCREAFLLHTVDGLARAEIAERMAISCSAAEKHIVRGLLACRACEQAQSEGRGAGRPFAAVR